LVSEPKRRPSGALSGLVLLGGSGGGLNADFIKSLYESH
jgi:hypothetical protein